MLFAPFTDEFTTFGNFNFLTEVFTNHYYPVLHVTKTSAQRRPLSQSFSPSLFSALFKTFISALIMNVLTLLTCPSQNHQLPDCLSHNFLECFSFCFAGFLGVFFGFFFTYLLPSIHCLTAAVIGLHCT